MGKKKGSILGLIFGLFLVFLVVGGLIALLPEALTKFIVGIFILLLFVFVIAASMK